MDARIQVPQSFSDNRQNNQPATEAVSSAARPTNSSDERSLVASRVMRMLRLHDRARAATLASHSTHMK